MADTEQRRGYGDLAQAILDLVGQAGAPVTPAQVRDALGRELAYTTVQTMLAAWKSKKACPGEDRHRECFQGRTQAHRRFACACSAVRPTHCGPT